ncbi:MAG: pyruvate kinase [Chloroflexi bacterium]|nr:pyruvate kinase [Chloroflexota bacterium]
MKNARFFNRRTKIVCTIGPATGSAAMIERLIRAGMNVARLNLSHGTFDNHARYVDTVKRLSQRLGINVATLIDLAGPKYRTGKLKGGHAVLKRGATLVLTTRQVEGDATLVPVNLTTLPQSVKAGDTVLLDDGRLQLTVLKVESAEVKTRVTVGGPLTEGRGLVIPGMPSIEPFISDSLRRQIIFAVGQKPDYLALSFVSSAANVSGVKGILRENRADIPVIAKIERGQAVHDFDSILEASDGVMVARGDLGVDIPIEKVPMVQKDIIRKCNRAGKPVITATEMLESMVNSVRPTRAEVTDVANAIFDGSDAVMLSAETSVGKYPAQAVRIMAKIAQEAENKLPYERILAERGEWFAPQTEELISYNACHTAQRLKAAAIVAFTESGSTAGRVSKYRPGVPILAITPSSVVAGRLLLRWGVHPFPIAFPSSIDELFATGARLSQELGLAKTGDLIVITGGIPIGVAGSTNLLKVEKIT